jgi:redox-sensitive bicupin YhaK (pirin superfamily)
VTLVDIRLQPGARFDQEIPDSYNGFLYVLDGEVFAGGDQTRIRESQVGWVTEAGARKSGVGTLSMSAGKEGARVVLYAGERQGVPIVQRGPFVGESRADLMRLSRAYVEGKMPRISELALAAKSSA